MASPEWLDTRQRKGRSSLLDTHLLPMDMAPLVLSPGAWASSLQIVGPSSLHERTGQFLTICSRSLYLCLTLCDPMDCSPPGSSVHGIL